MFWVFRRLNSSGLQAQVQAATLKPVGDKPALIGALKKSFERGDLKGSEEILEHVSQTLKSEPEEANPVVLSMALSFLARLKQKPGIKIERFIN